MKKLNINKKNKKSIILAAIFLLFFFISSLNLTNMNDFSTIEDESSEKDLNIKAAITVNPITIVGNWSATREAYNWIKGSGGYWDPYRIENVTINVTGNKHAIYIENTNEFFVIRNCTLVNIGGYSVEGIKLKSVEHGLVENNTIKMFSNAVYVQNSNIVKITNNLLTNSSNNGAYIVGSYYIYLNENNIQNSSKYGIDMNATLNSEVSNNTITKNSKNYGIRLYKSNATTIESNFISLNKEGILIVQSKLNTITKNTVQNQTGTLLPCAIKFVSSDYNMISLNEIKDNAGNGTYLYKSQNNIITQNNYIRNTYNVRLENSSSNTISQNNITNSKAAGYGIHLKSSDNNFLLNNVIRYMVSYGIYLQISSKNNTIEKNVIFKSYSGIDAYSNSDSNKIKSNNISNSSATTQGQIRIENSKYTIVEDNTILNGSKYGLEIVRTSTSVYDNTMIRYNTFQKNKEYGIRSSYTLSRNNTIYLNNFINNYQNATQGYTTTYNDWYSLTMKLGNYWSNHTTPDKNKDGVIDNMYKLNAGKNDTYPLKYPFQYYNFSKMYVDQSYTINTIGWNVTRFSNMTLATSKLIKISFFSDPIAVYVNDGAYKESFTVAKRNVSIIGNRRGGVIINASGSISNGITIANTNDKLINLTVIEATTNGISSASNFAPTIENCIILNNQANGINARNVITIKYCNISSNKQNGIYVRKDSIDSTAQVIIAYNTIYNNSNDGIRLQVASSGYINAQIKYNEIIENNRSIYTETNIRNTLIMGNNITSNKVKGIVLASGTLDSIITKNNIVNNGYADLLGTGYGVEILSTASNNSVFLNDFINNNPSYIGFPLGQAYDALPVGNHYDNEIFPAKMRMGNYWFGFPAPDLNEDGILEAIYPIQPIIGQNDKFPLKYPSAYYDFNFLVVDDDFNNTIMGWNVTRFDTIQKAVNKADGGAVILINNGTYHESVFVNKALHLIGDTMSQKTGHGVIVYSDSNVFSLIGKNIRLEGITIQNNSGDYPGIFVNNSNIVILRNINVKNTYNGITILNSKNVFVDECYIEENEIYGLFTYNSSYINIVNNTFSDPLQTNSTGYIELTANEFTNSGWILISGMEDLSLNNVSDNTVNNKTLYYVVNQLGYYIEGPIGQLYLINSDWTWVYNASFSNTTAAIGNYNSHFTYIEKCLFTNVGTAGFFVQSDGAQVFENTIQECLSDALLLINSQYAAIYVNMISNSDGSGIVVMDNSQNCMIIANNIINNTYGIYLQSMSSNTTIFRNNITSNFEYGIYCDSGRGNEVFRNNFYGNGHNQSIDAAISATDPNVWYNDWDSTRVRGNYWSNFITRYPSAVANYTLGEWQSPDYIIDGFSGKSDIYPLIEPFSLGPFINIISPLNNTYYKTQPSFTVEIIDPDFGVDKSWFTINGSSTKYFFTTNSSITLNWSSLATATRLNIRFYANNMYGYVDSSDLLIIYKDTINPDISNINYNSNVEWSTGKLIANCTVTDNYGLRATNPVEIMIRYPNGTTALSWTSMTKGNGNLYAYNWSVVGKPLGTIYNFTIRANDKVNNSATTTNQYFNIRDTVLPSVSIPYYTASTAYGTGFIYVNASASDNYGLQLPVQIRFYKPNSAVIGTYSMSLLSGTVYKYNWTVGTEAPSVNYYFRIIATDQSNNVNNSTVRYFNITDTIKPVVVVNTYSSSAEYSSGTISVTSTITDNYQVQSPVNITFSYPNGTAIGTYGMSNPGGSTYTYSWSVGTRPPLNGYKFTISARDPSLNFNNTVFRNFNIVDTVVPSISNINRNSPVEWNTGQLTVTCTVIDNYKLRTTDPVQISIYYPNNSIIISWGSMSKVGNTFSYYWLVTGKPFLTNYYFRIKATDNVSNVQISSNQTFDIKDSILPTISNVNYNTPLEYSSGLMAVSCNVTDNYGLRSTNPVAIRYYTSTGTPITGWLTMTKGIGTGYSYSWSDSGNNPGTNYYFRINATDYSSNTNLTTYKYFNIVDTVKPNVVLITYYGNCTYGGSIYVYVSATDNYQLKSTNPLTIKYFYANKTLIGTYTMSSAGGNTYSYTWPAGTRPPENNYNFTVIAEDYYANINNTVGAKFNITDLIQPTISSPAISPNPVPAGNSTEISAIVTDNYKLADTNPVGIMIYNSTNHLINWSYLIKRSGNYYNISWDSTGFPSIEDYYIKFNATDKLGNIRTVTIYFDLISGNPPKISNQKVNPTDLELGLNLTISANVTDNEFVANVIAYIYYPNDTLITTIYLVKDTFTNWSVQWNSSVVKLSDRGNDFYVIINATDNLGFHSWTANLLFNVVTTKPVITDPTIDPTNIEYGGSLTINATVTDNEFVYNVIASIYYPNGTLIESVSLNQFGNLWNNTWSAGTHQTLNGYYVVINATDNKGYVTSTGHIGSLEFNILDTTDPQILDIDFNVNVEWSTGQLIVDCNATDNYKLRTTNPVEIIIYDPYGCSILEWTSMTHGTGNAYSFSWSSVGHDVDINYYFVIRATDIADNDVETASRFFNITDTVDPSISDLSYNSPIEWGIGQMDVSITATDNYLLNTTNPVQISYYYENYTLIATFIMDCGAVGYYYFNWSVGSIDIANDYYFIIIVYDSSNNKIESANQSFNIIDTIKPIIESIFDNAPVSYETGSLIVNVTVTDNYKLKDLTPVNITIYYPNDTLIGVFVMTLYSVNEFSYIWSADLSPYGDCYYYFITAIDYHANFESSLNYTFSIIDNVAPSIFITSYDLIVEYHTGTITVNATVTDNYLVEYVRIKFYNHLGEDTSITLTMVALGDNKYTYKLIVLDTGIYIVDINYFFIISTMDYSYNNNETESFNNYFDIMDTTKPILNSISLVNNTYHKAPPSFTIQFDESVTLKYYMISMALNQTVGSGTNSYTSAILSVDFNGLSDGWFNLTFYFEDIYGNLNFYRLLLNKDTTLPSVQFIGESPNGKDFEDTEAPVFYINVQDANISAVRYYILSKGIDRNVPLPGASMCISGLMISDLTNFPVSILMNDWAIVDYGSVQIIIRIFDQANNNNSLIFTVMKVKPSESTPSGDDTGTGQGTTQFDMLTIIFIVIGVGAAIAVGGFIVARNKKAKQRAAATAGKLHIKAPAPGVLPGKMIDGKLVGEKAKKAKKAEAEEAKQELTPDEIAALKSTEKEMQIEKKEHTCIVHKGPIKGAMYLCPKCETFYCMTCARTLKANGEKCWSCDSEIDVEVPLELKQRFDANTAQGILESTTKYDATFKKAMTLETDFKDVSQLNNMEFVVIDPEILKKLDKMELSLDKKKEVLNDLRGLSPTEQQKHFESMFVVEEDEEQTDKK